MEKSENHSKKISSINNVIVVLLISCFTYVYSVRDSIKEFSVNYNKKSGESVIKLKV